MSASSTATCSLYKNWCLISFHGAHQWGDPAAAPLMAQPLVQRESRSRWQRWGESRSLVPFWFGGSCAQLQMKHFLCFSGGKPLEKKTAFGEAELCLYCTSSHSDNWLVSSDDSISTDMPAKLGLKSRLDLRVFNPPAQSSRWIRSGCWEKESHLKGMCGSQMEGHNGSIPRKPWSPGNPQTRRGIVQNQGSIHDLQTWRRQK